MGYAPTPFYQSSGTLGALNAAVTLDCPGTGDVIVAVQGTFVGTITATGSANPAASNGPWGGRLLFKSGVGSLGTNSIVSDGSVALANEYRVTNGAYCVRVQMTGYTSGSATVQLFSASSGAMGFVNGPVHTAEEEAVRAGRAFSISTGVVPVAANNYLNCVLVNPTGSGKNLFLTLRQFLQDSTTVLSYTGRSNPGALTGTGVTSVTPTNRRNDALSVASVATFSYQVSTTPLTAGTTGASNLIPAGGVPAEIAVQRTLAPGTSMGYVVGGLTGGLAVAVKMVVNLVEFEELVN